MDERQDNKRRDQRDSMADEALDASPSAHGARSLRALLIDRYGDLKSRLARRLGSSDWAEDALQDTYLRLDGTKAIGEIHNPGAYLFRAAFNTAINQRRAESRRLSAGEVEAMLHVADDAPDAQRIIEGRSDIARLKAVMAQLPPRTRAILLAARLDGLSRQEIADHFGISVSLVEKELKRAQEHCAARFKRSKPV